MMAWWKSISSREQNLLLSAFGLLIIACLFWGVWKPLQTRMQLAEQRVNSERQLLVWVQNNANEMVQLRKVAGKASTVDASKGLNRIISSSTARFKLDLIRMQPRNEDSIQVWVKPLPFNQLIDWLAFLRDKYGIDVQFLDTSKADRNGQVIVNRLQLGRG